jgi:hypothetical protein
MLRERFQAILDGIHEVCTDLCAERLVSAAVFGSVAHGTMETLECASHPRKFGSLKKRKRSTSDPPRTCGCSVPGSTIRAVAQR